jgi:transcriptional regulator with XRE-family HTH domain/quercetin dioxygenase-like cupin family protein
MSDTKDHLSPGEAEEKSERSSPGGRKLEIGARLAALRAQRGLKASTLARQIGLSPSLISQIERGQSRPSVSTLVALAEALDVRMDDFFRDPEEAVGEEPVTASSPPQPVRSSAIASFPGPPVSAPQDAERYVVRRANRWVIEIEGGVRWERLTPLTLGDLEFLELVYEPHAESHSQLYRHSGVEMVLVLSGRLDIHIAFERYELEAGDSICFPSTRPHRYVNPTDETTRAVSVRLADEHRLD